MAKRGCGFLNTETLLLATLLWKMHTLSKGHMIKRERNKTCKKRPTESGKLSRIFLCLGKNPSENQVSWDN